MSYKLIFIFSFIVISFLSNGQALFPEKFEGCETSTMVLESDTAKISMDPREVADLLVENVPEKLMRKLVGRITLQVIVYRDGNNCVLSVENESNITTKKLNLKDIFDTNFSWSQHKEIPISTLIELKFNKGQLNYRRLGFSTKRGLHELYNAGRSTKTSNEN